MSWTKSSRAKDGSRFRSLQREEEILSFSLQQEAQTFNPNAQKRPVCLSVWVPSYLLLHSEWLNNLATVRPPPCYICAAIRHGWALCAADEWPDNVCLGLLWTTKYTTGTLTACRHIGTTCHLVSSMAWFSRGRCNTTCCCLETLHGSQQKLKSVKQKRIRLFSYDINASVCSARLGQAA